MFYIFLCRVYILACTTCLTHTYNNIYISLPLVSSWMHLIYCIAMFTGIYWTGLKPTEMRVCNNSFFFPLFLKVTWSSSTCKCRLRWRNATHKCSKGCKWASPSGILCSPDWSINTQTFCFAVCGVSPKISR